MGARDCSMLLSLVPFKRIEVLIDLDVLFLQNSLRLRNHLKSATIDIFDDNSSTDLSSAFSFDQICETVRLLISLEHALMARIVF